MDSLTLNSTTVHFTSQNLNFDIPLDPIKLIFLYGCTSLRALQDERFISTTNTQLGQQSWWGKREI